MSDNATAHAARDYEAEVARTIPFHDELLRTAVEVVTSSLSPKRWLDTGCGPGKLATQVQGVEMWLADPSPAMLSIARERNPSIPADHFISSTSQDLADLAPFDAITAIQSHHYGDVSAREKAVTRCRELLAPGGVLVVFENVLSETSKGQSLQRKRWAAWQRRAGRDEAAIAKQLEREGKAFFPIRVSEHMQLFARLGLEAELVWRAYGQAGFVCYRQ